MISTLIFQENDGFYDSSHVLKKDICWYFKYKCNFQHFGRIKNKIIKVRLEIWNWEKESKLFIIFLSTFFKRVPLNSKLPYCLHNSDQQKNISFFISFNADHLTEFFCKSGKNVLKVTWNLWIILLCFPSLFFRVEIGASFFSFFWRICKYFTTIVKP